MTLTKIEAKTWFLASGTKKVGPMTKSRLRERVTESKTPARLRAWREGMDAWLPVAEIPELDGSSAKVAALEPSPTGTLAETLVEKPAPARLERPVRPGRSLGSSKSSATLAPRPSASPFVARYRTTRPELWRAFSMGFEAPRLELAGLLLASGIALQVAVLGAMALTPILGIVLAIAAVPAGLILAAIGLGALGYQTRRRIETGATPGPLEALAFARDHALALTLAPVVLSLVALAPPILLLIKSLVGKVPGIGEPAAGLTFGIDLALSAGTFFFGLAAALGWSLSPAIVVFEETGVLGTVKALLGLVKGSFPRFVFWSLFPRLAVGAMGGALLVAAVIVAAPPLVLNARVLAPVLGIGQMLKGLRPDASAPADPFAASGHKSEVNPWDKHADWDKPTTPGNSWDKPTTPTPATPAPTKPSFEPAPAAAPAFEISVGFVGVVLWCFVLLGVVAAILASTQSALNALVYLACRPGNDELMTRDHWLAQQSQTQGGDRAQS